MHGENLKFSTDFRKIPQVSNFLNIRPGGRVFPCERTDRRNRQAGKHKWWS